MIKNLETIVKMAKDKPNRKLAVAAADDEPVLEAIKNAQKENIIDPILVGCKKKIEEISKKISYDLKNAEIIDIADPKEASKKAVSLIRENEAEILMKGMVSTGGLLKAVLNKEKGLRKGNTISHVAFFESSYYHKILCVTDAAMNVEPEFEDKVDILNNAVETMNKLGIQQPKVAVIGAVETVNAKMEPTVHAAMLTLMNKRKQIKNCIVDGPLALDNAVSKESAEHKGIVSEVAGDADILLLPDIYAGNVLYKSLGFLGGATIAAVIMGAAVPIVLTSRSDNEKSKLMSIALAAAME